MSLLRYGEVYLLKKKKKSKFKTEKKKVQVSLYAD